MSDVDGSIESFISGFKGTYEVIEVESPGALSVVHALALRDWFDARRAELESTGGRPTNPRWTLRRQVPFDPRVWEELKVIAYHDRGQGLSPGQIAAILVEEGAQRLSAAVQLQEVARAFDDDDLDPKFRAWKPTGPFAAAAAA